MSLEQKDRRAYKCAAFSYALHALSCRVFLHLMLREERALMDTLRRVLFEFRFPLVLRSTKRAPPAAHEAVAVAKNETRERFSQCSMMWATISKATIPRVARDAANTKRVRRFSSVVIIAKWKPTLASILTFRACQRV
jgi:hypothetical protein